MDWKAAAKKLWWFLWEDSSIWSWLANIVLAFIVIKFLVYPGLSLLFGTSYPIVAVVSGSMEHQGLDFDSWWNDPRACCRGELCQSRAEMYEEFGITMEHFDDFRFTGGFNKGDLMVLVGDDEYEVGDVLVFMTSSHEEPIIHRIVKTEQIGTGQFVSTKGDNNCGQSSFEKRISEERFVGKAVLRIPFLGWIKIGFVSLISFVRGVVV